MAEPRFDASKSVTFDLANGLVHLEGAPLRVLTPPDALLVLAGAAGPEATRDFGRALGGPMGQRVAQRLRGPAEGSDLHAVRGASLEAVVEHLGTELALVGLGSLAAERWGRALVLVVDHCPLAAGAGDVLLGGVLESALAAATGRAVSVGVVARDSVRARFFVGSEGAMRRLHGLIGAGTGWAEAIARLHDGASPARGGA